MTHDAWPTPAELTNSLYWRLVESGRPTNAFIPVGKPPFRDRVEAWVFEFVYAEHLINVAFTHPGHGRAGDFLKAVEVENGDWKNYAPQLPALTLNTRFRTAFEWFLNGESARSAIDFSDEAVAANIDAGKLAFYTSYNPVAVKRDRVPRTVRKQLPR